jgi:hypothetical protein
MTFFRSGNNLDNGVFSFDCSDLYDHVSGMFERPTIMNVL